MLLFDDWFLAVKCSEEHKRTINSLNSPPVVWREFMLVESQTQKVKKLKTAADFCVYVKAETGVSPNPLNLRLLLENHCLLLRRDN